MHQKRLKKNYSSKLLWLMWISAALFFYYENVIAVSPGVMFSDWMRDFYLTASTMGGLAAYSLYAYSSVQIPAGIMFDYFGPRRLLALAAVFCAVGSLIMSYAHGFYIAASGRAMIGLGSGFAALGCLHIASSCLPLRHFTTITGLTLTMGMTGSMMGEGPLAFFVEQFGWRHVMWVLALIGFAIALLIYIVVRDFAVPSQGTVLTHETKQHFLSGIVRVMRHPQSWIIALYGGLMFTPFTTFGPVWGVPFLVKSFHLTRTGAASMLSLIFLGFAIGAPLLGAFSDRLKRRRLPLYLASFGALICLTAVICFPKYLSIWAVNILLFSFGFFTSGFLSAFSMMRENHLPEHNTTSLGFMNMINMIGGALIMPLIGWAIDHLWDGTMQNGIRTYHLLDYQTALFILPLGIALSLCILPFLKETHAKNIAVNS